MKSVLNDKSMDKSETLNKSDYTGVPSNANDAKMASGVQNNVAGSEKSGSALSASETAGLAGSDVNGGDLTAPQNAAAAMDEMLTNRDQEQQMQQQQIQGNVAQQTVNSKPAAAHPESGMPSNADGKGNSGGANEAV